MLVNETDYSCGCSAHVPGVPTWLRKNKERQQWALIAIFYWLLELFLLIQKRQTIQLNWMMNDLSTNAIREQCQYCNDWELYCFHFSYNIEKFTIWRDAVGRMRSAFEMKGFYLIRSICRWIFQIFVKITFWIWNNADSGIVYVCLTAGSIRTLWFRCSRCFWTMYEIVWSRGLSYKNGINAVWQKKKKKLFCFLFVIMGISRLTKSFTQHNMQHRIFQCKIPILLAIKSILSCSCSCS